jgi:hypothetical protein
VDAAKVNGRTGLRSAIAVGAFALVAACGADDDLTPRAPPELASVVGNCRAIEREDSPAMYRCYGRSIREEPLYDNADRDLYAVLAAKADVIAERIERRQITAVEARLLWETAKSEARSESMRRAPRTPPPDQPPGP